MSEDGVLKRQTSTVSSLVCILKKGYVQSTFESSLSFLVYPVESTGSLRVREYFNAIYICGCPSSVTPGPENDHSCWRKALESRNSDCHLYGTRCFAGCGTVIHFPAAHDMPSGKFCSHIWLDPEPEQVAISLVVSGQNAEPWSSKLRSWAPLTGLSLQRKYSVSPKRQWIMVNILRYFITFQASLNQQPFLWVPLTPHASPVIKATRSSSLPA